MLHNILIDTLVFINNHKYPLNKLLHPLLSIEIHNYHPSSTSCHRYRENFAFDKTVKRIGDFSQEILCLLRWVTGKITKYMSETWNTMSQRDKWGSTLNTMGKLTRVSRWEVLLRGAWSYKEKLGLQHLSQQKVNKKILFICFICSSLSITDK